MEFLCSFFDVVTPFFEASSMYRKSAKQYIKERKIEKDQFWRKITYLKKRGMIQSFIENKEKYYELTDCGRQIVKKNFYLDFKVKKPDSWDGLWRVVIFDVPEKFRQSRDILRRKLTESNFYQIQKSGYVYPYECTKEVSALSKNLMISRDVVIMVSEIIQGEEDIIDYFLERKIIKNEDLITRKR
jgi:DNA-binding transcriptional regulator PaaX